jgi:hypothetical protein
MTEAAPTLFYLGCAALLTAAVLLRLSAKMRAGFFTAVIITAIVGAPTRIEHVTTEIIALN